MLSYVTLLKYGVMDNHVYVWKGLSWMFERTSDILPRDYRANICKMNTCLESPFSPWAGLELFGLILECLFTCLLLNQLLWQKHSTFWFFIPLVIFSDHIITSAPPTVVDWMWKPFINRRSFCLAVIIVKFC